MGALASIVWNAFWLVGPPLGLGAGDRKPYLLWGFFAWAICGTQAFWTLLSQNRELQRRIAEHAPKVYLEAFVDFGEMTTLFVLRNNGDMVAHQIQIELDIPDMTIVEVDHLESGKDIKCVPTINAGSAFAHPDLIPPLNRLWQKDVADKNIVTELLVIPFAISYKDHTFKQTYYTDCTLEFDPGLATAKAMMALNQSPQDRIHKDIITIRHRGFRKP